MASHKLGIEVIETVNPSILKIMDFSVYANIVPFICPRLWVTAPGFKVSAEIPESRLVQGFSLTLTACDLDLQQLYCDSKQDELPDGIYAIRYAVSPHEYVFVDINHLRTTKVLQRLEELYCDLDVSDCILPAEKATRLRDIYDLEAKLRVAKANVACGHNDKGMLIYEDVLRRLEKIDCKYC